MTKAPIEFWSVSGEIYSATRIRPVVLGVLGRRYGVLFKSLLPDWRERANTVLDDETWLRWNNGMTPGGLAEELFTMLLREVPVGRTHYIDPDFRHEPKTDRFCCRCQKDIQLNTSTRWVYLRSNGAEAVHPADVATARLPDDLGWWRLGPECVRIIGAEWTVAEQPDQSISQSR